MIRIHNGDIFKAPVDIIIHQCNCFNTMGSGIAKEIKKRFPAAAAADQATKKGSKDKLGNFSFAAPTDEQDKWIVNLYGQYKFGNDKQYTNYAAVGYALLNIYSWLLERRLKDKVIGIPYGMGAGLGGGDWETIEEIIREVFEDTGIKILICKK